MTLGTLVRRAAPMALLLVLLVGCAVVGISHRAQPPDARTQRPGRVYAVDAPARAHLHDGRTVLYRQGFSVFQDTIRGPGAVFGLRLDSLGIIERLPLDDIAAMESIHPTTNVGATLLLSVGGTLGSIALFKALFGSCPTFYSQDSTGFLLEAEGFSYSLSPLLESRDVDLLGVRARADGRVELEVRNEALETHFINHVELLEVRHAERERVVPAASGWPLALAAARPFPGARDRGGRDVQSLLAAVNDQVYDTPRERVAAATKDDLFDWIDLTAARPEGVDSVAITLRLRNSLLTTVLLYDYMLAAQGPRAVSWLGRDIEQIDNALDLATWYTSRMGMRVAVQDGGNWREVARLPATGPLAWETVALTVPVPRGDSLRVRLTFASDEWRVDQVTFTPEFRRLQPRVLPVVQITDATGAHRPDIVRQLSEPDEWYLETRPGTRFNAVFDAGAEPASGTRTFLLASQGYYVEWIRADWMRSGRATVERFIPSDGVLLEAMRSWNASRDTLEHAFFNSRIPVR